MDLNKYLMSQRDASDEDVQDDVTFPLAKRIECTDGFSLSVQATHGSYCSPRTNIGPWSEVEVGFPSAAPTEIMGYAQTPEMPTKTVYGYVPILMVEALIEAHGGMKANAELSAGLDGAPTRKTNMDFWTFWSQHPFLAWCALWLLWGVVCIVLTLLNLASRVIRLGMVSVRGWPPSHLDADGDWKPEPDDDTEDNQAPSNKDVSGKVQPNSAAYSGKSAL